MRQVKKAIKRERHITPTIDDVILNITAPMLSRNWTSTLDITKLNLHPNHETLQHLHTCGTQEVQAIDIRNKLCSRKSSGHHQRLSRSLEGARNISDDIIVFAKTQKEHDCRLKNVLQSLLEKNITLNKSKCDINKNSVEFFGYHFNAEGVSADWLMPKNQPQLHRTLVNSVVFSDWPITYLISYRTSKPLWLHYALLPTKTQHGTEAKRNNLHLKNSRRNSAVK